MSDSREQNSSGSEHERDKKTTSDNSGTDDDRHTSSTTGQEPSPEFDLLDKNFENIFVTQVAMLDKALLSLKKTTDHILSEVRGQPTAIGLEVKNPETGKRIKLDHVRFIRLNKWLGSNIDILRRFIWQGENDSGLGGDGLDGKEISGDLNKDLSLLCDEGFSGVIRDTELLLAKETIPPRTTIFKDTIDARHCLELIKEEHNRLKVWISNTKIDEGALSILVNHDLYKQAGEVLQSILVDLISLCEGCFTEDFTAQNIVVLVRNQWLDEAKKLLTILPDKSNKTENHLFSDASPRTPGPGPLISEENLNEGGSMHSSSGILTENRNITKETSAFNTPLEPPFIPQRTAPSEDPRPSTPPQYVDNHRPTQLDESAEPAGSNPTRPGSRGSIASSTYTIIFDERPLPEYLIKSLKESNKTLITLVRSLEMAKANMGEGTHSQVYQAVRDIKDSQKSQPSSPVEPFNLPPPPPPPPPEPFQFPSFIHPSPYAYPPREPVEGNSRPGTIPAYMRASSSHSRYAEPGSPLVYPVSPVISPTPPIVYPVSPVRSPPGKAPAPVYIGYTRNPPRTYKRVSPPEERLQGGTYHTEKASRKRSDGYLWGRIKSAALTENRILNDLLEQLEEIGFGLYCDRHSLLFSNSGLEKWVILEVLRCMWHDDSQMTRDSFAEKAKGVLSGKKDKWNFPESQDRQISGKPDPYPNSYDAYQQSSYLPRRIAMESQGRSYQAAPPQNDIHNGVQEHTRDRHRQQNSREQQLISSTPHNPFAAPYVGYPQPPDIHLPPTRAGTFEMPIRVEQGGNRDQYQAQNSSHGPQPDLRRGDYALYSSHEPQPDLGGGHYVSSHGPQPDLGGGHYAPYSSSRTTDDMINRAMGRVTHSSPYTTHIGVARTHPAQNTNTDNTFSNAYQGISAAYLARAHNKDGIAKDTKEDGPEGAPPKSNLSKNKMKALRPEVSSVDPVDVLNEEARDRYE